VNQLSQAGSVHPHGPTPAREAWDLDERQNPRETGEDRLLNVRAVEFIARAGKASELQNYLQQRVFTLLARQIGFAGAIVLTSQKEPRRVSLLSFWRTENESSQNQWEFAPEVQSAIGSLIDASSRVQTYDAALSRFLPLGRDVHAAHAC
jgi:heme-degrading monooxygenase HmoA